MASSWRRSTPERPMRTATQNRATTASSRRWTRPCNCVAAGISQTESPMLGSSARSVTSVTPVARNTWPRSGPRWLHCPRGDWRATSVHGCGSAPGVRFAWIATSIRSTVVWSARRSMCGSMRSTWRSGTGDGVVERIPRLRGQGKHLINYRHVIDSLVRKPGAFENYKYREDMFPTSRFRMAYDALRQTTPKRAAREYVQILELAARENESLVDDALR